jgi:hypothetical protein
LNENYIFLKNHPFFADPNEMFKNRKILSQLDDWQNAERGATRERFLKGKALYNKLFLKIYFLHLKLENSANNLPEWHS